MVTISCAAPGADIKMGVQEFKNLIVLSGLAAFLVAGVVAAAAVNPYVLLGLAPVLLAIAAIVRAVGGRHREDHRDPKSRKNPAKATTRTDITRRRRSE